MRGKYHFIDGKFITFDLNREEYAIALERVLEIVGPGEISDTDHDDPCVRGVVKVRDLKVPVLDLYCRFGLAARADKEGSSVLVAVLGRA
ncbi:MAG TPA: chemotaxis protein CheW, partial [bacterium]|nr:chemotaxis protein CheW [bacterium]